MKLPALSDVLNYEHSAVLKLYNQNYPDNTLSASCAFQEVKKYLWLSQKHAIDKQKNPAALHLPERFFMVRGMQEIDEMWHEFILFTADYMHFCETFFGEYLHHLPNLFDNRPRPRADVERDIAKMLPYIHEHLGEESVRIWFAHYLNIQA